MNDKLVKKVAEEIDKHSIGCEIVKECNTECEKCAAEAVIPIIAEEIKNWLCSHTAEHYENWYRFDISNDEWRAFWEERIGKR